MSKNVNSYEHWESVAKNIATREDDSYFAVVAPIVYVGPAAVAAIAIALLAHTLRHNIADRAFAMSVVVLLAVAVSTIYTRRALRQSNERRYAHVAKTLYWLTDLIGNEGVTDLVANRKANLMSRLYTWERLSDRLVEPDRLPDLMADIVKHDALDLIRSVEQAGWPSIPHGWTTDENVVDVLPRAMRAVSDQQTFTPEAFRAALRKELYKAA
jgi:uncharacterized membrane protein (DUF485 family)